MSVGVSREECSQAAWDMLEERRQRIEQLNNDLVKAYKRLCKYEGHLIIEAPDGTKWCELCEQEVS